MRTTPSELSQQAAASSPLPKSSTWAPSQGGVAVVNEAKDASWMKPSAAELKYCIFSTGTGSECLLIR